MPDMDSPEEQDVARGETTSDVDPGFRMLNLHITVSRILNEDGTGVTKIWYNRKVRKLYAVGLLSEAIAMLHENSCEVDWTDDTPGCFPDEFI